MAKHRFGLFSRFLVVGFSLLAVQCDNAECEKKRDELYNLKLSWEGCQKDSDCIVVGGNPKDCTGAFACNFAVNLANREEAERRVLSLPQETVDCHECSQPNCPTGERPYCEPKSGHCMLVNSVTDGGTLGSSNLPAPPPGTGGAGGDPSTDH